MDIVLELRALAPSRAACSRAQVAFQPGSLRPSAVPALGHAPLQGSRKRGGGGELLCKADGESATCLSPLPTRFAAAGKAQPRPRLPAATATHRGWTSACMMPTRSAVPRPSCMGGGGKKWPMPPSPEPQNRSCGQRHHVPAPASLGNCTLGCNQPACP